MSINILFKKYSSRLALAGDAALVNAVEEFSQSVFESGVEQFVGSEDRTVGEILKEASFEAALGFVGGGAAGATTIQFAYNRMDDSLRKSGISKPDRHRVIMRSIADGSSILESVLREGLGANQDDLDIVNQISSGEINSTEALAELNKRIMERQKAKGIDTYLDSDPDTLIEEQKKIDAAEEIADQPTVKTPDEEVEISEAAQKAQARVDERETKVLREGREVQINQELDLLEADKALVNKDIEQRAEQGKPTKAAEQKRDKINAEIEALLDEIELLPTAEREALAAKIVATKGKKISGLRNQAEIVAARIAKEEIRAKFKQEKADLKAAREELSTYVRESFKGLPTPQKFVTRVAKVTPRTLDKFLAEVDQARVDIIRPALVAQINKQLGRVASKVKSGKAAGVLKSAALQDVANELIRVSKIDSQTANQLLSSKQQLLTDYFKQAGEDNAVTGEIDVDRLNFEMEVIQNLAGLDGKDENELMTSLAYARGKVQLLREGGKIRQEQLKEQREQERIQAVSEMKKKTSKFIPKWLKSFSHFSTSNLSRMLESLVGKKDVASSVLGKKIAALDEAPRKEASFNFLYLDGLEQITKRAFGLKDNKEYSNWKNDWFKEGGGYDSGEDIELNNGTTSRLVLAKGDVSYWWMVTHDRNGNEIPEMVEQFTGENARTDLEQKALEADESEGDFQADLSQVKGNAIPLEHWQEMMGKFEQNPANVEFAQSQRALFNTVYSIINPVYRMYMGVDLPRVDDYIPWHRDVGVESDLFSALDDFRDLVQTTPRSTKLRTPGATAAFRQVGDIEIFQYFVQEMAHFNAFALPMKDIISLIRNKDVRTEINRRTDGVELAGGIFKDGDSYKNLRKMADFVMSRGRSMNEFSLGLFNTMRSNISIAYLGEPSKAIMQTSSMWMALSEKDVTWGDWMAGFAEFIASPRKALELLDQAPMMKFRYKDLMIEMRDAINHIKVKDKTVVNRFRKFITPKAFAFVRAGNRVGAGISGYVVFRKVHNETGDVNEAFRRFDQHLVNTQQSAIPTQVSPFQVGQTNKVLSHFQSAVIQYARIYTKAWSDFGAGRISVKKLVDVMLVFHILMPTMRWMLKALIRGGDFDPEELKKDIVIGPLTAGFIIPDIIEGLVSIAFDVHSFGASSTLAGSVDKINKVTKRVKKQMTKVLEGEYYDAADLANTWIELGEEASTLTLPIPGITFDGMQAAIKASQGEMTPMEILSVILGESVESLEFKNKGSNNTRGNLFRR